MPKVTFVNEKKEVEVQPGANLRQEAAKAGVEIYRSLDRYVNCRGLGMCGTCSILVKKGAEALGPKTLIEKLTLARSFASIGNENEIRLACQTKINGDCSIETKPPMNWYGENFWQKPYPNK
jgi:ferredoxin